MREQFRVEKLHEPVGHYTEAVRWGDLLFVSGVSPINCDMSVVSEDISEQTRKVFENMGEVLTAADTSFANVLKITVFLKNLDDRNKFNVVSKGVFGSCKPASTFVGIAAFIIPGTLVEIEAIVAVPRSPSNELAEPPYIFV